MSIAYSNLSDDGVSAIAEALKINQQLQELWLGELQSISDDHVMAAELMQVNFVR